MIRRVPHLPFALALATVTVAVSCGSSTKPSSAPSSGGATAGQGASAGTDAGSGGALVQSGAGSAGAGGAASLPQAAPSKFIVVDQFGYRPDAEKIAVLRDPQTGYDAADSFTPGKSYSLIDARSGQSVLSAAPVAWNGGMTDPSSGDKAWSFDFSSVKVPGTYYVLDADNGVRSDLFNISDTVYREILKRAVRTFFLSTGRASQGRQMGRGSVGRRRRPCGARSGSQRAPVFGENGRFDREGPVGRLVRCGRLQ